MIDKIPSAPSIRSQSPALSAQLLSLVKGEEMSLVPSALETLLPQYTQAALEPAAT